MEVKLESTLVHTLSLDKDALRELIACITFRREHASGITQDHPIHRLAETFHHYAQTLAQYEPLLSGVRTEALPAVASASPATAAPETPKNPESPPPLQDGAAPPPPPPFPVDPPPAAPQAEDGEPEATE